MELAPQAQQPKHDRERDDRDAALSLSCSELVMVVCCTAPNGWSCRSSSCSRATVVPDVETRTTNDVWASLLGATSTSLNRDVTISIESVSDETRTLIG